MDAIVKHDMFLQSSYLQALESASPENIQSFYIGIFKNDNLIGVGIIQRVQLYLKDMFRNGRASFAKEVLQNNLSKLLKGNLLVLGNLTHTGQHGVYFNPKAITQAEYFQLIFEALKELKQTIKAQQNKKIRAILLKDYFKNDLIHEAKHVFKAHKLHQVFVQPNMIMPIQPSWIKMDDYVASLNSKYKTRYKRAKKKLGGITCKELDLETIENNSKLLYGLYLNVSNNAAFNTFILPINHFYQLKKQLKENFKVFGYYINEDLVGFFTLILNNNNLETYFLGYDEEHQYSNQLYLNMLYDMAKFGIENKFYSVVYARTAMEIKSSIGAKPKPMVIYLKHTNSFMNTILKFVFGFMSPAQEWEERHPFS